MNFYDVIEIVINEEDSIEEIAAEYAENMADEEDLDEQYPPDEYIKIMKEPSLLKRVSEYLSDKSCCSKKCCDTWIEEHLKKHADDMNCLSKNEKKIVILTVLRNCALNSEKTRYSGQRLRVRFSFRYEPFGIMCASAFRLLFDIRMDAFKGLLSHLKTNNMSVRPPLHGNSGKNSRKPDTLVNRGVTEKVVEFMLTLGESQGEFSSGRDIKLAIEKEEKSDLLWLPACLNRSALFRLYNRQYADFPIGRTKFVFLLKAESRLKHIRIRSPRSDMCDYCELQKRKIAATKPHDELKTEILTKELAAHQKAYQGERAIYNSERKQAIADGKKFRQGKLTKDNCVEHICIDYGQSIGVPNTADQLGGTYFLQMRNFILFGIYSGLENTQICYTYDEREAGKGANEVISFLHNFLCTRAIQTPNIRIHADNCVGQNKNKYVMWYLIWLAATGRVKHVEFKFMIKGHTQFIVDGNIGHIKRELRRSDVFCLQHWEQVIDRSATNNKAKVVIGNDVYDWKKGLYSYFKNFNGVSKFQHFAVDSNDPGQILLKCGYNDDAWKKRKLLKSAKSIKLKKFQNLPKYLSVVGFKGGKPEKEKALYENLRPYVKDEWKDELCPDPETFKTPVRIERSCPDWLYKE